MRTSSCVANDGWIRVFCGDEEEGQLSGSLGRGNLNVPQDEWR